MGKIIEQIIDRFDGGMTEGLRGAQTNECATMIHFDSFTDPHALRPHLSTTGNETGQTSIGQIIVGNDGLFYGLGTDVNNPTLGDIYKKATYAGNWAEIANTKSGALLIYPGFIEFKSFFYYWKSGALVVADKTGVAGIDTTTLTVSGPTNTANMVIHPKDGILYVPYDNNIATLTGATKVTVWNATALVIPDSRYRISSIAPYGNYLAIAITPITASAPLKSQVLLWDRDSSVTTVSETIDWGPGQLQVLNNLGGTLIGVSDFGSGTENVYSDKLQIKGWNGGTDPFLIKEFRAYDPTASTASVTVYPRVNFIFDNKMYFSADVYSAEPRKRGLFSVSKNSLGQYAVVVDRIGNTSNSSTTAVISAAITGDRALFVHTADGTITITTSGGTVAYGTATWTSPIFNGKNSGQNKRLVSVGVMTEPLPSGATAVVSYRKDSQTGFQTAFLTSSTTGAIYKESVNEASGAALPQFREIQFEIQSTGGAVITGLKFKYEEINDNPS